MQSRQLYQPLETESDDSQGRRGERSVPAMVPLSSVTGALVRGHGSLLTLLSVPSLVVIVFCAILLLVIVSFASYKYSKASGCLGAPYLYVSHSKEHNIMQLTRDGCLNMNKVLFGVPRGKAELRSMAIGQYKGESALYVADASPHTSQVSIFGDCSYWTGMRSYRASVFTRDGPYSPGAVHAYGISFDKNENIYASFQHTNVVLQAAKDNFDLLPEAQHSTKKSRKLADSSEDDESEIDISIWW